MAEQANNGVLAPALVCTVCGSHFLDVPNRFVGRRPRFCSDACRAQRVRDNYLARYEPKPAHDINCKRCGKAFQSKRPETKWCSRRCSRADTKRTGTRPFEDRKCRQCSELFRVRKDNDRVFCSDGCRAKWHPKKPIKRASVVTVHKVCAKCSGRFHTRQLHRKFCSSECRDSRVVSQRACQCCGVQYQPSHGASIYCSLECKRKAARAMTVANGTRAAQRQARKLRLRGVQVESVNPIKVLERDGWHCQLCGIATPKKLRGTYDDRAPEVDHIITLAMGGEHSYRNVQCACRKCNLEKSGISKGQMRLFG